MTLYDRARFEQASWPTSMAQSARAGVSAAGRANVDRLKAFLGLDTNAAIRATIDKVPPQSPSTRSPDVRSAAAAEQTLTARADMTRKPAASGRDRSRSDRPREDAAQQDASSESSTPRTGRETQAGPVEASPEKPQSTPELSTSGASTDAASGATNSKPATSRPKPDVRKPASSRIEALEADHPVLSAGIRAFVQTGLRTWTYAHPPPSRTAVKFQGWLSIRGHKGTVLAQVTAYSDPCDEETPLSSMSIHVVERKLHEESPRGDN